MAQVAPVPTVLEYLTLPDGGVCLVRLTLMKVMWLVLLHSSSVRHAVLVVVPPLYLPLQPVGVQ